jgi:SAM-dependent methyltransferase
MRTPQNYAERLGSHIDAYLALVAECPDVRLEEFSSLTRFARLPRAQTVLEVPAEGPVLDRLLPDTRITRAELVEVRFPGYGDEIIVTDWGMTNLPTEGYDAVLALAPLHHADNQQKRQYVNGAYRVVRESGVLAFGEVERESAVVEFLDGYVNDHSPVGHRGAYLDEHFEAVIREAGFVDVESERIDFHWVFPDEATLEMYLTRLFRLKPLPVGTLTRDVQRLLGIDRDGAMLRMRWALRYFRAVKPRVTV